MNFFSSYDTDKEWTMHSKSDNIEVMTYDKPGKIIEEFQVSKLSGIKDLQLLNNFKWL